MQPPPPTSPPPSSLLNVTPSPSPLPRSTSSSFLPRDHLHQLERAETDLLQEIHALQNKLAQTRRHLSNPNAIRSSHVRPENSISTPINTTKSTLRSQLSLNDQHPRTRVVSVSFRLPRNDHRVSPRQLLFDAALPPKAMLALQDAVRVPFVCVGSDPPDVVADPDLSHFRTPSPYLSPLPSQSPLRSTEALGHTRPQGRPYHTSYRNVRVHLPDDPLLLKRYLIFCDDVLWPLMHHDYQAVDIPDLVLYWDAYQVVNARFAEAVSEICEDGDLIWVHNFHLMLLPAMLRETVWYAKIGFFLYTPFPSAELFRILPYREEILRGIIGADIIGFHSYDHVKQFVTSCRRQLGLDATPSEVIADAQSGRICKVGVYPGGIDVDSVHAHISSKLVKSRVAELRARFEGFKLIIGVDRLDDCFAGLLQKLLAFERLLSDNPHLVGNVVLIQAAMLPKQARSSSSYREQRVLLNEYVTRVNSTFGTWAYSPIHFINVLLDPAEIHALMCVGHVCVVTTVRDGMGLVPHEWTVCQHGSYNGAIVLSEFASAAHSFATALHVNPWDVDAVATKMKLALELSDTSRQIRNEAAYRFVTSHTAIQWGSNFLDDLDGIDNIASSGTAGPSERPPLDTSIMMRAYLETLLISSPTSSATGLSSMSGVASQSTPHFIYGEKHLASVARNGLREIFGTVGVSHQPPNVKSPNKDSNLLKPPSHGSIDEDDQPPSLSTDGVKPSITPKLTRVCLFVLDLDGTLVPSYSHSGKLAIAQRVVDLIQGLVEASPHNHVLLMSSSGRQRLHETFGHLRVFLAAEDGAFLKAPNANSWTVLFRDPALQDFGQSAKSSPGNTIVNGSQYGTSKLMSGGIQTLCSSAGVLISAVSKSIYTDNGGGDVKIFDSNTSLINDGSIVPDGKRDSRDDFENTILAGTVQAFGNLKRISHKSGKETTESNQVDQSVSEDVDYSDRDTKPTTDGSVNAVQSEENGSYGDDAASAPSGPASLSSHTSFSSVELGQGEYGQLVSWKENVLPVMEHFAERTPGVIIEQGEAIMTWHYDDTDENFGEWQARHLFKHLESLAVRKLAISLLSEDSDRRWIRVRPKDSDKTKALTLVVKRLHEQKSECGGKFQVDFVLCVGNDRADEGLFEVLTDSLRAGRIGIRCKPERIFTCRVGSARGGPRTSARTFVETPARVVQMLEAMCGTPAWALL